MPLKTKKFPPAAIPHIKNRIEQELRRYIGSADKLYSLSKISPLLFKSIVNFILRKGKRARPILFVIGYLGFARKPAPGLYRSALSLELLHDFMLVHDDIIDKSSTRRGKPSMHEMFNQYLKGRRNIKFNGQDLTIIAGDVMYAMSIQAFLGIKENLRRKETALKRLIDAAMYTGSGEFIELLAGLKGIDKITREEIYQIYDYKTANYTFATPLSVGAGLAGAGKKQVEGLFKYGIYLGRAFQIKDDLLGMFGKEKETGKSILADLQEAKKTLLIWQAFRSPEGKYRAAIRAILSKKRIGQADLLKMRRVIAATGALDFARQEISRLVSASRMILAASGMRPAYKDLLERYTEDLLAC
ncbi:MAG: hypothetical protein A3G38_01735 [Omnitrophica WOR_2 bacterium RIFCSPLOWO2_12_FULL_51_8]|nr:MAG: hypothetical protein A3G38_01735 [Omnitrophica WOR_2 bacterium RIFCSPLOWO2_12_FULL_51_8]